MRPSPVLPQRVALSALLAQGIVGMDLLVCDDGGYVRASITGAESKPGCELRLTVANAVSLRFDARSRAWIEDPITVTSYAFPQNIQARAEPDGTYLVFLPVSGRAYLLPHDQDIPSSA